MSVKHIKEYFNQVAEQYSEMLNEIRDFEKEAEEGLMEPERLEQIKQNIIPLKNNFQMLSYVMFLLNKPVKKEKHKRYTQQNKKLLAQIESENTKEGVLATNQKVIDSFKK